MEFNALLQRAQNLTYDPHSDHELPRVERTLQQVLQAADELHSRLTQTGTKDIQAHILLGSKGIDLPKLNQKLDALDSLKSFDHVEAPVSTETDVRTFLKNERENAILSVIEETNKNISDTVNKKKWTNMVNNWNEEKTRLLDALVGPSENFIDLQRLPEQTIINPECFLRPSLDAMEKVYAKELSQYNELLLQGKSRPNLVQKFAQISVGFADPRVIDIWDMLACVTQLDQPYQSDPIKDRQKNANFVLNAKTYLEHRFKIYMNALVQNNSSLNSYQLVEAFVKHRFSEHPNIGFVDITSGRPLWPLVYYSLRCGAGNTALEFLAEVRPHFEEFEQLVADRNAGTTNSKIESQLRLQYANKIRNTTDAYKKIVYCIMLGCDTSEVHSEVAKTTDDFLWVKLAALHPGDTVAYGALQSLILEKYGEKHFNAKQQTHLYFQTLVLTGQFEAAIEFLARSDANRTHAVHMAIALHELGLLGSARSVIQPLLSIDVQDPPPLRRLNLARLIKIYVQRFELNNMDEALHYYYALRHLRDADGRNMFLANVCEMVVDNGVLDTNFFHLVFGRRETYLDNEISSGFFDQFDCPEFRKPAVAAMVADELVRRGNFEMAVKLYDLAGKHNLALKHLSILIAQVVHQPPLKSSLRSRLVLEAEYYSGRLLRSKLEVEPQLHSSFTLLQTLLSFYDKFHEGQLLEALRLLDSTQLIPANYQQVDACLINMKRLSGEVLTVVPDVMITAMDITYTLYNPKETDPANDRLLKELRDRAKAVTNLAATMPHRMPFEANKRLLQLELLIN